MTIGSQKERKKEWRTTEKRNRPKEIYLDIKGRQKLIRTKRKIGQIEGQTEKIIKIVKKKERRKRKVDKYEYRQIERKMKGKIGWKDWQREKQKAEQHRDKQKEIQTQEQT
jgi:hypothetical protein